MTFIEKYEYLKKKYASKADVTKLKDSFIAAQLTLSDEDCGGTMYAAYIDGKIYFEPYDYHDNTVAVIIDSALLEDCIKGKADPAKEYFEGHLQAWGNLDHALQIIECLKGKKKAPAKKKTEEAVKEEASEKPAKKTCTRKKKDAEEKTAEPAKKATTAAKKTKATEKE